MFGAWDFFAVVAVCLAVVYLYRDRPPGPPQGPSPVVPGPPDADPSTHFFPCAAGPCRDYIVGFDPQVN